MLEPIAVESPKRSLAAEWSAQAGDSPVNGHELLPLGQRVVDSGESRMPAERGEGRIRSYMRRPESPTLVAGSELKASSIKATAR